jgi:hypothetical protein
MASASTDGTKYQAVVRYMHSTVMSALGKDPVEKPLSDEKVAALAKILEKNRLTPTRNDRRFPNQNQANNCWFVRRGAAAGVRASRAKGHASDVG